MFNMNRGIFSEYYDTAMGRRQQLDAQNDLQPL